MFRCILMNIYLLICLVDFFCQNILITFHYCNKRHKAVVKDDQRSKNHLCTWKDLLKIIWIDESEGSNIWCNIFRTYCVTPFPSNIYILQNKILKYLAHWVSCSVGGKDSYWIFPPSIHMIWNKNTFISEKTPRLFPM